MSAQPSTAPRNLRMLGWRPLIAFSALGRAKALSRLIGTFLNRSGWPTFSG